MRNVKYEDVKKEIQFWFKFMERIFWKKLSIKVAIFAITFILLCYLGPLAFSNNNLNDSSRSRMTHEIDLSELIYQAMYVHITQKFGYKECYFVNAKGEYEMCYCYKEYHPETFTPVHKLNPEIAYIIAMGEYDRGFLPGLDHQVWTRDGYPLIYYHFRNGRYECFTIPGYHPEYGEELKPVTLEIANEWANLLEEKMYHRFILIEERKMAYYRNPMDPDYYEKLLKE